MRLLHVGAMGTHGHRDGAGAGRWEDAAATAANLGPLEALSALSNASPPPPRLHSSTAPHCPALRPSTTDPQRATKPRGMGGCAASPTSRCRSPAGRPAEDASTRSCKTTSARLGRPRPRHGCRRGQGPSAWRLRLGGGVRERRAKMRCTATTRHTAHALIIAGALFSLYLHCMFSNKHKEQ